MKTFKYLFRTADLAAMESTDWLYGTTMAKISPSSKAQSAFAALISSLLEALKPLI